MRTTSRRSLPGMKMPTKAGRMERRSMIPKKEARRGLRTTISRRMYSAVKMMVKHLTEDEVDRVVGLDARGHGAEDDDGHGREDREDQGDVEGFALVCRPRI